MQTLIGYILALLGGIMTFYFGYHLKFDGKKAILAILGLIIGTIGILILENQGINI